MYATDVTTSPVLILEMNPVFKKTMPLGDKALLLGQEWGISTKVYEAVHLKVCIKLFLLTYF